MEENEIKSEDNWINPDPIKVTAMEMAINASISGEHWSTTTERAIQYEKYLRSSPNNPNTTN